jgi:hypothetical protein
MKVLPPILMTLTVYSYRPKLITPSKKCFSKEKWFAVARRRNLTRLNKK